ncbi:hypothetical protein K9857_05045 [Pseudomonas sp. REP124]|nr:hypothetical protein [Pseudomonas sp. REP124]MBZ9780913.1 hypothetical protein [Pseudomonas sp. REP124]
MARITVGLAEAFADALESGSKEALTILERQNLREIHWPDFGRHLAAGY